MPANSIGLSHEAGLAGVEGVVVGGFLRGGGGLLLLLLHEGDVGAEGVVGGLGELVFGAEVVELAVEPAVRGHVTVLATEFARGELGHGLDGLDELVVGGDRHLVADVGELLELGVDDGLELVGQGLLVLGLGIGSGLLEELVVVLEPVVLTHGDDVGDLGHGEVLLAVLMDDGLDVVDGLDDVLEHLAGVETRIGELV